MLVPNRLRLRTEPGGRNVPPNGHQGAHELGGGKPAAVQLSTPGPCKSLRLYMHRGDMLKIRNMPKAWFLLQGPKPGAAALCVQSPCSDCTTCSARLGSGGDCTGTAGQPAPQGGCSLRLPRVRSLGPSPNRVQRTPAARVQPGRPYPGSGARRHPFHSTRWRPSVSPPTPWERSLTRGLHDVPGRGLPWIRGTPPQ